MDSATISCLEGFRPGVRRFEVAGQPRVVHARVKIAEIPAHAVCGAGGLFGRRHHAFPKVESNKGSRLVPARRKDAVESLGPRPLIPALLQPTLNSLLIISAMGPSPRIREPKRGSLNLPPRI